MIKRFIYSMKLNREIFRTLKSQKGYSLIELVMVTVFLGVAIAATLTMMTAGISKSFDTENLSLASMLAEQKLEEIRGDKNGRGYHFVDNESYVTESNAGGYSGYTRTVLITTYQTYKEISVTVSHSNQPSFTLVTQLTNY